MCLHVNSGQVRLGAATIRGIVGFSLGGHLSWSAAIRQFTTQVWDLHPGQMN